MVYLTPRAICYHMYKILCTLRRFNNIRTYDPSNDLYILAIATYIGLSLHIYYCFPELPKILIL